MKNILITISYDGTNFCGWQRQTGCKNHPQEFRTVQGEIKKVLEKIHKQKTDIFGAGRTDSGVHALAQTANFFSPIDSMSAERYIPAMNSLLPRDIRIHKASEVPMDFSARFNATSRTYRYFINTSDVPFAHKMPYIWAIRRLPDINVLNEMASCLKGEIDCTTFCSSSDLSKSKNRYIYDAHFFMQDDDLVFEITANAFLWKMVRSITGTLIELEGKGLNKNDFLSALNAKDRTCSGFTAPPQGLFLYSVCYEGKRIHP